MKMKLKMNGKYGQKYTKYKLCVSITMKLNS